MKTWETKSGYSIIKILGGRSNVFLLKKDSYCILIDTSVASNWFKLESRLSKLNIHYIDILVLTHTHFDHAANAQKIKEKYGAKVLVHKTEAHALTNGFKNLPQGTHWFSRFLINSVGRKFENSFTFIPCNYDILIDSKIDLIYFGLNGKVIHTPGHTEGSISVIVDNEIAIVGDTMFGAFRNSIFPPFGDDVNQMVKSWGALLNTHCRIFLPAHGSAISRELLQQELIKRENSINGSMTIAGEEL